MIEKLRNKILDHLNKFTKINRTAALVIEELDVLPKIRETENIAEDDTVEEETTTLQKKDNAVMRALKRLFRKAGNSNVIAP